MSTVKHSTGLTTNESGDILKDGKIIGCAFSNEHDAKLWAQSPELFDTLVEISKCKRGDGLPVNTVIRMMAAINNITPFTDPIN